MFQTACTSFLRNSLPSWVSASPGVATTQVMQLKILATQLAGFSEEDLSSLANSFQVLRRTSRRGFWEVLEEILVKQERAAWSWSWRSEQLYQQIPTTQKNKLGGFWKVLEEILVKQERGGWNWRWRSEQLDQQIPNTQKNKLGRLLRGSWGDFSETRKRRLKYSAQLSWCSAWLSFG